MVLIGTLLLNERPAVSKGIRRNLKVHYVSPTTRVDVASRDPKRTKLKDDSQEMRVTFFPKDL